MVNQTEAVVDLVHSQVGHLYNRYPYPNYPIFATPHWSDGYKISPVFAQALVSETPRVPTKARILVAGAGEILPYIMYRWLPKSSQLTAVDLSRVSLRRAQFRIGIASPLMVLKQIFNNVTFGQRRFKKFSAIHGDLDHYLAESQPGTIAHIDAFGVLHHMANPSKTIAAMAGVLIPGGTLRLMVYNSPARSWIHDLQKILSLLNFSFRNPRDVGEARNFVKCLAGYAPFLMAKLQQLGPSTLLNNARFCDTFLHPREIRIPPETWLEVLHKNQLRPRALFDRYGELDHLQNPLWTFPDIDLLAQASRSGEWEGNLEIYCQNRAPEVEVKNNHVSGNSLQWMRNLCKGPPPSWWTFSETCGTSIMCRWRIWHAHLFWLYYGKKILTSRFLEHTPLPTLRRLARLGAILPGSLPNEKWIDLLNQPLYHQSGSPSAFGTSGIGKTRGRDLRCQQDDLGMTTMTSKIPVELTHWVGRRLGSGSSPQNSRRRLIVLQRIARLINKS